jgi:hypothetical protein
MIPVLCDQGSPEWHRARCGRLTASNFHIMRAIARLKFGPNAGDYSAEAKNHAFRVSIERISEEPLDGGFETWAMTRGHELEPEARGEHEVEAGVIVERVGFMMTDDGAFGCSLDGIIRPEGRSEYKCYVDPEKIRSIVLHGDISMAIDQVQGGLWISEGEWMDFCLYCPALRSAGKQLVRKRIYRDDNFIEELEADLLEFKALVDDYERILRAPLPDPEILSPVAAAKRLARRRHPVAPSPAVADAAAAAAAMAAGSMATLPLLSEFDRIRQRIVEAPNEFAVELILDGISHLPETERVALRAVADAKFATA